MTQNNADSAAETAAAKAIGAAFEAIGAAETEVRPVYVHRCDHCGMEYTGFGAAKPVDECAQCGRTWLVCRKIDRPAAETIEEATRETEQRRGR